MILCWLFVGAFIPACATTPNSRAQLDGAIARNRALAKTIEPGAVPPEIVTKRRDGGVILMMIPGGYVRDKQAKFNDDFLNSQCKAGYEVVEEGRVVSSVPRPAAEGYKLIDYRCK